MDRRLVAGAVLFGIGWGLAGLCPGPALLLGAGGAAWILPFLLVLALGHWAGTVIKKNINISA